MFPALMLLSLATFGLEPPTKPTATDAVTLRDDKVLLGQVLEADRRGPVVVLARRAWAEANLPEWSAHWAKVEGPNLKKAVAQRRGRLVAWRRERGAAGVDGDRITPWIDREVDRLADPVAGSKSPLMIVRLARADVKSLDRKPETSRRLLRLGWLSDLPDVETMPREDLTQALEGRGFSKGGTEPVSVDPLLPNSLETDLQWQVRRAATEVVNDPGGRLIRYQGLVIPEPLAGEAPPAAATLTAALGSIQQLLGDSPVDPLPGKLRELAGQGRVGAIVTTMNLSADLSSVGVESTLWVRAGQDWGPALTRRSTVRPDDLPADAGAGLADDPQIQGVFGLIEGIGLGEVPPEWKRRSLTMGAATRKALGQAKGDLARELNSVGLSLQGPRGRVETLSPSKE